MPDLLEYCSKISYIASSKNPIHTQTHSKSTSQNCLIMPALSCPNATNAPLRFPTQHLVYPPPNLSAALFNISAVFLIILAASSQSFFSIASLAKGNTAVSSALLASGAKMACLNWSRPGSCHMNVSNEFFISLLH